MEHFVEDDVAHEKLGNFVLIEVGVDADKVIFFGVTAEAYGAAESARGEFAPDDGDVEGIVEFVAIDFVVEALDVVDGADGGFDCFGAATRFFYEVSVGLYKGIDHGTGAFTSTAFEPTAEGIEDFWGCGEKHVVQPELSGVVGAGFKGDHAGAVVGDGELEGETSVGFKPGME